MAKNDYSPYGKIAPLIAHGVNNIKKKKYVKNDDGSISTVFSMTVNHPWINNGMPTNIPSVYDGKKVDEREAVFRAAMSDGAWPAYDDIESAVKDAKKESEIMDKFRKEFGL